MTGSPDGPPPGEPGAGGRGPDVATSPRGPEDDVLVLAPSRLRAGAWTIVGAVAIGCAGWTAGRSSGVVSLVSASLLLASVGFTLPFALQTFVPSGWTLRYAAGRLWGYAAGVPVDIDLLDERPDARLRRVLGDHALRVTDGGRRRWVLLPVGADTQALQRALDADVTTRADAGASTSDG